MPNFHADHSKYTGEKCELSSPMIQICQHNLGTRLFMASAIGFIAGLLLAYLVR